MELYWAWVLIYFINIDIESLETYTMGEFSICIVLIELVAMQLFQFVAKMHLLWDVLNKLDCRQEEVGFDYVGLLLAFDKKDNQVLCSLLSFFTKVHTILLM